MLGWRKLGAACRGSGMDWDDISHTTCCGCLHNHEAGATGVAQDTHQLSMCTSECRMAWREARVPPLPRLGALTGSTTTTCSTVGIHCTWCFCSERGRRLSQTSACTHSPRTSSHAAHLQVIAAWALWCGWLSTVADAGQLSAAPQLRHCSCPLRLHIRVRLQQHCQRRLHQTIPRSGLLHHCNALMRRYLRHHSISQFTHQFTHWIAAADAHRYAQKSKLRLQQQRSQ